MRLLPFTALTVIAFTLAGCATEKAPVAEDLTNSNVFNVQPINHTEKCLMPGHELMKEAGVKRLWDGDCKDGYASGFGRDMILSESVHFEHYHYLSHAGQTPEAPYAWYYMHDERQAVGVMRNVDGNAVFSGSICHMSGHEVDALTVGKTYATGEWRTTEPKSASVFITEGNTTTMRSNAMPKDVVLLQMTNGVLKQLTQKDYDAMGTDATDAVEMKLKLAAPLAFEARQDAAHAADFISTYQRELCKRISATPPAGIDKDHYLEICK